MEVEVVAVLVAERNMAEYLDRCLESIVNQTYKDLEIVIVDDGSTDGSAEILDGFQQADPRIKVIYQENKGHSEARNVALANSKSEYVYFIDADDYIHPQTIEILLNNLLETDSDISIGCSIREGDFPEIDNHYKVFDSEKALEILTKYSPSNSNIPQFAFNPTWNRIFKRYLFDDIKFPTGHLRDDNFTCHRLLAKANRIVWTKAVTYFYFRKPNTMSESGLFVNKDLILAHQDRIAFFKEQGYDRFLPDACSFYLYICYKTFLKMGDYSIIESAKDFIKNNKQYLEHQYYGTENMRNIVNMDNIIIYTNGLTMMCGLYIWTLHFCKQFRDKHIKILCKTIKPVIQKELEQYAECEVYNETKSYQCRTLIQNFQVDILPKNIIAAQTYVIIHCDYAGLDYDKFDKSLNYICVSDVASKSFKQDFNLDSIAITPFISQIDKRKVYRFVSATRLNSEKGIDRTLQLAELFKQSGIYWQWIIYCERDIKSVSFRCEYPEIVISNIVPNDVMLNYMADADYVIQLSDSEGFCYAVHESLMMGTPVIVTDIPIFRELIQDGYNGYRVPLNMQGIDIQHIIQNIPKNFVYINKSQESKTEWEKILKDD